MADSGVVPPADVAYEFNQLSLENQLGKHRRFFFTRRPTQNWPCNCLVYLVCPDPGPYRLRFAKITLRLSERFPKEDPIVRFCHESRHPVHPNFQASNQICISFVRWVYFGCYSFHRLQVYFLYALPVLLR
jgi:ubiquitin-protein ligase